MTSQNASATRFRASLAAVLIALALLVSAERAMAVTWCVPDATVRTSCPKVSPTIQGAIDRAASNDMIYIGAGNPPERLTIDKRLTIKGLPGHRITDEGLPPGGTLLSIVGDLERGPRFESVVLDVVTSDTGIYVAPTVIFAEFRGARVTSEQDPKPAVGMQASGTSRMWFIGARRAAPGEESRMSGFQVGFDLNDVDHVDVEYTAIEDNDVGIRLTRGGYQVFFNALRNNGVGLEVCGLNVCDINSNTFVDNGLGVYWALCHNPDSGLSQQKNVEFNHNTFAGNGGNVMVETSPGVYSDDHNDDPGCFVQWTNMLLDGIRQPNIKARTCGTL